MLRVVGIALGIGGYSRHLAAFASFCREGEPLRRLFQRPCMLLAAGEVAPHRPKIKKSLSVMFKVMASVAPTKTGCAQGRHQAGHTV